jgi:hypothetical protein
MDPIDAGSASKKPTMLEFWANSQQSPTLRTSSEMEHNRVQQMFTPFIIQSLLSDCRLGDVISGMMKAASPR